MVKVGGEPIALPSDGAATRGYLAHVTSSDLPDFRALRDQGRNAEALTLWRGNAFEDIHCTASTRAAGGSPSRST
ncbi:hypothetical protein [Lentzea nigeriaca]|uniref:hypothetical protein n=1 Tax=Lentzea nigeriaca TaxID=1128665 RepID=UPI00195D76AA|nr:hypothetical protein [Lentzea nigeriaca]MBM7862744.1 hypothetical protein [Lentzea nigeriaca]